MTQGAPQPTGGSLPRTPGLQSAPHPHFCGATKQGVTRSCTFLLRHPLLPSPQPFPEMTAGSSLVPLQPRQGLLPRVPDSVCGPRPETCRHCPPLHRQRAPDPHGPLFPSNELSLEPQPRCSLHSQPRGAPGTAAGPGSQPGTTSHARDHRAGGRQTASLWAGAEPDRSRAPAPHTGPDGAELCAGPAVTLQPAARCLYTRASPHDLGLTGGHPGHRVNSRWPLVVSRYRRWCLQAFRLSFLLSRSFFCSKRLSLDTARLRHTVQSN